MLEGTLEERYEIFGKYLQALSMQIGTDYGVFELHRIRKEAQQTVTIGCQLNNAETRALEAKIAPLTKKGFPLRAIIFAAQTHEKSKVMPSIGAQTTVFSLEHKKSTLAEKINTKDRSFEPYQDVVNDLETLFRSEVLGPEYQ
jgi:hypothetical protein